MHGLIERVQGEAALLSPIEHVFCGPSGYTITFVFSFSSTLDRERLQDSLTQTVVQFPWVWSQLEETDDRRSFRLAPRAQRVLLESGQAGASSLDRERFVGSVETEIGSPLASFRLTQTASGSVLGVSMSHAIADGASFFHFLTSWSRIARGEAIFIPVRVAVPRSLRAIDDLDAAQIWSECGLFSGGPRTIGTSEELTEELLYMSHAQLKAILARAQEESSVRVSTNDVVTAYLWQKFVPGWCDAAGESEASVTCPVDMRLIADIPRTHFGCALGFAVAKMEVERLRHAPLGVVAAHVRQAIKSVDAPHLLRANGTLEQLRYEHGLRSVQNLHLQHPRSGMIITNMTRMPISELDFGAGAPTSFSADARQDHAASFYAHPEGIGFRVYTKRTAPSVQRAVDASSAA